MPTESFCAEAAHSADGRTARWRALAAGLHVTVATKDFATALALVDRIGAIAREHGLVLAVGDRIPDARVWLAPREEISLRHVAAEKPLLLLFYLFDWSST